MADPIITNVDTGTVVIKDNEFRDDVVTFTGAATYAAGTILARLTATDKLVAFVKGGAGGAEVPKAVLIEDLTATGAGDLPARPCVAGNVEKGRLIILADGDDSNIDAVVLAQLRDYGIVALDVAELSALDNQ